MKKILLILLLIPFIAFGATTNSINSPGLGNVPYSIPSTAGSAGKIFRFDGTNALSSTSTFADTYSSQSILMATSANTVAGLATANNAVMQTDGSGNVSLATPQTYTPTIGDGTNNFTTSTAEGYYYRVGARTYVNINLVWTGKGSAIAGNGLRISLPITAAATPTRNPFTFGFTSNITALTQLVAVADAGNAYINMFSLTSGSTPSAILVSSAGNTGSIQFEGFIGS